MTKDDLRAWAWLHLNDRTWDRRDTYLIVRPRYIRVIRWPLATWRCCRSVPFCVVPVWRVAWVYLTVALTKVAP